MIYLIIAAKLAICSFGFTCSCLILYLYDRKKYYFWYLMRFFFPEFLFALFLIAIPVIIHLFNFRKFKKVYFSNTRFLKDIQIQTSSKQKIKERLILLSRILTVTFLVFAFAKPYFPSKDQVQAGEHQVVSIYVDNSYSMEAVNKEGSLLEEAKRKAAEVISTFGYNDKFQLLTNDLSGYQNTLLNKDEFLRLLDSLTISPQPNNFNKVVTTQRNFLQNQHGAIKKAFLISDFQRNKSAEKILLDSLIAYQLITLKPNELPNIAIDSAWLISPLHQPNAEEKLVVKISNYSNKKVEQVALSLKINNQLKAIGSLALAENSSVTDTLSFSGLNSGWQKGTLFIKDYPLVFDDQYHFAFEVKPSIGVTILNRNTEPNNVAAAFSTDAFFEVHDISESQINYTDFKKQRLIVLHDLKSISAGLAQQLKQYVESGGSLSVFMPLDAVLETYQSFLQSMAADYPQTLIKDTLKADKLNLNHAVFKDLFDQLPDNIDLPYASEYFKFTQHTKTSRNILISGETVPLLNIYKVKKGLVYLSAFPLENNVSNLTSHGLFLPLLFKMALLTDRNIALAYETGKSEGVFIEEVNVAASEVLKMKSANLEIIPEIRNTDAGTVLFFADQIRNAGFYELYQQDKLLAILAFNDSRAESEMAFYEESELKDKFGISSSHILKGGSASIANQIKEVNLGTSLWKLCLILVLIFLAAEILLVRFYGKNKIKAA